MTSNQILSRLFSLLPIRKDQVKLIIWYGNKQGIDIDLLVILKDELSRTMISYYGDSLLDIGFVGEDWIPMMIKHLDPIIVEPILTGEPIWGNIDKLREDVLKQEINEDIPVYLLQSAEIFYEWAIKHVFENRFREAILTLCFVSSFVLYAERYWSDKNLVLFKDLLSSDDGLWIRQKQKIAKKKELISESDVRQVLIKTRLMLTNLRVIVGCG